MKNTQGMEYSMINQDELPDRWADKELLKMSDSEIEELVEDIYRADHNINLPAPFTQNTVNEFFKKFNCRRCGRCCVYGADGVFLYPEDIKRISKYLQMSEKKFKKKFTLVNQSRVLLPLPCPFYNQSSHFCTIYQIRPRNCRLFPFFGSDNPRMLGGDSSNSFNISYSRVMTVNARCQSGREIACEFLKMKRNGYKSPFLHKMQFIKIKQ